jgi:hypothetical protein
MTREKKEGEEEERRLDLPFVCACAACTVTYPSRGRLRGKAPYVPTVGRRVGNSVRNWKKRVWIVFLPLMKNVLGVACSGITDRGL